MDCYCFFLKSDINSELVNGEFDGNAYSLRLVFTSDGSSQSGSHKCMESYKLSSTESELEDSEHFHYLPMQFCL